MTAIQSDLPLQPERPGFFAALYRAMIRHRRRRAERLTLLKLSHYDAHLLRDMGIDPLDVEEALRGGTSSLLFDPVGGKGNER
jgi:uncharacterized protein YjiS (DUF1127 family)